MKSSVIFVLCCLIGGSSFAQSSIPDWFIDDLRNSIGTWAADNGAYKSAEDPRDFYILKWEWGIGKTSIVGRLYGTVSGVETGDFWQFRQYWDTRRQSAVLVQYGHSGVVGVGDIEVLENGMSETIQEFSEPGGQRWLGKHVSDNDGSIQRTTSYQQDEQESWVEGRSYTWRKTQELGPEKLNENASSSLGAFSVSLSVKNIEDSFGFYQKLGFEHVAGAGGIGQGWMILNNGNIRIGLFQGLFPKNTITFNPDDGRSIHKKLQALGIRFDFVNGMDEDEGPVSFTLADPDGNPILIDQH